MRAIHSEKSLKKEMYADTVHLLTARGWANSMIIAQNRFIVFSIHHFRLKKLILS